MRQDNTIHTFSTKLSFSSKGQNFDFFVLYLRKIVLLTICIFYCLISLNSVLFKPCLFRYITNVQTGASLMDEFGYISSAILLIQL